MVAPFIASDPFGRHSRGSGNLGRLGQCPLPWTPAFAGATRIEWHGKPGLIARNLDRVLIRVVDIYRLDRADRSGARALHPDRHAAAFEMGRDLGHRRLGDETDMRRHALFAAHRRGTAGSIEMDLLLAEIKRGAAFAHALSLH